MSFRQFCLLSSMTLIASFASAATVSGYIQNMATRQPIRGAVVNAGTNFAYTDANGWYQLVLSPGRYNVLVAAGGYLDARQQVNVGKDMDLSLSLSTAGRISGTVTDDKNQPVANAEIYVSGGQISTTVTLKTNAQGRFGTDWLSVGSYEAFAVVPGVPVPTAGSGTKLFSLGTGENQDIQLKVVPTSRVSKIDEMPGWESCTRLLNGGVCASGLGDAGYSMEQGVARPSLDGGSAQFDIWGNVGYSNALFWKQVTPNDDATHFVFDWWVYIDQPDLAQSLEFDLNQTVNKTKYIFGSQCNFKDTGKWDVWDGRSNKWIPSGLPCVKFQGHRWNHFTWNLERVDGKVHYISLAINGVTYPVEMWEYPQTDVDARELNAAVQLDGNYRQEPYSIWVDSISITAW